MKYFYYLVFSIVLLMSCKENKPKVAELPSDSIFNLTSEWQNQNNDSLQLKNLQGKTLVVVMIYTSCKSACPILVSKMKSIEAKIDRKDINQVSLVLVSIDPKRNLKVKVCKTTKWMHLNTFFLDQMSAIQDLQMFFQ
ncbi:MAG: SCO family protein [Chitinophagales bacterium]|nr:SCO family protein [Chitinophagales bacterium]